MPRSRTEATLPVRQPGIEPAASPRATLAVLLCAQLMIVLDGTMMFASLPHIQAEFGLAPASLSWVQNAYVLALGGGLLLGARTGDIVGHRRVFFLANALFVVASVAGGLAPSATWLVTARAMQGCAAAFAAPAALALLMIVFAEGTARARALRGYTAVSGAGSALGLVLGGLLTSAVSWRATLFVNVPVGLLLMTLPCRMPAATRRVGHFDFAGALSGTLGMTALIYGLVSAAQHGVREHPMPLVSIAAAVVLLALFLAIERRAPQPILPMSLFESASRAGAYAVKSLMIGGMLGTFFFLTQYVQNALSFSAFEAGWAFVPLSIAQFLMVLVGVPRLMPRLGEPTLLTAGLLAVLAGMAMLGTVDAETSFLPGVAASIVLLGLGTGAALVPLATLGMAGVGPHEAGAASGLLNVTHYLGSALGTAVLVLTVELARDAAPLSARAAAAGALSVAATGAALFLVLALLIAIMTARREPRGVSQT